MTFSFEYYFNKCTVTQKNNFVDNDVRSVKFIII